MAANLVKIVAIAARIQTAYDTDPVPALATDAVRFTGVPILALNVIEAGDRDDEQFGGMGDLGRALPVGRWGSIDVPIALFGKGSAYTAVTEAFQHDVFLRGAGFTKSFASAAITYTDADIPTEYFTLYLYGIDGNLYKLINCVAKPKLALTRAKPGMITYTCEGRLLAAPAAASITGLALPSTIPAVWADVTTTIGAFSTATAAPNQLVPLSLAIDVGTQTKLRDSAGANGMVGHVIVDRNPTAEMQIEAVALTTFDPYAKAMLRVDDSDTRIGTQLNGGTGNTISINTSGWAIEQPTQVNLGGIAGWGLKGKLAAKSGFASPASRMLDIKVA